jgi:hemerythrin-like domain-containing protein
MALVLLGRTAAGHEISSKLVPRSGNREARSEPGRQIRETKEETILFPRMVEAGVPGEGGPIGVMLYEHDEGRAHIRAMNDALPKAASGDADVRRVLIREARGCVALLRAHIQKENMVLFPIADRVFDPAAKDAIRNAVADAEASDREITEKRRQWAKSLR